MSVSQDPIADVPKTGNPLINLGDCFPDLEELKRRFDIIYFLDLCAGLEATILYDEIYANPKTVAGGAQPLLDPLFSNRVLVPVAVQASNFLEARHAIFGRGRARDIENRLTKKTWLDADDIDLGIIAQRAASALPLELALEEDYGLTLVLSHRQAPIYRSLPSVDVEQSVIRDAIASLAEIYKSLSDAMVSHRRALASLRAADSLRLPPLAFEAIFDSDTFDQLADNVFKLRDRYAVLRRRIRELRELYGSADTPWRERVREAQKLKNDIERLSSHARIEDVPTLLEIAEDAEKVAEAIPEIAAGDYLKSVSFAGPIIRAFDSITWKLRMRPLRGTVDTYLNASAAELAASTRVLFSHELTPADLDRATAYDVACGKYFSQN